MHGRAAAAIVCVFIFALNAIAAGGAAAAAASLDSAIAVAGNRHIDAAMIRSHFHPAADGRLDAAALDAALKSLYATGLFADVKIARDGERVVVTVVENPTIERIAFDGNRKIKDEDLKKAVQSKERGPLSRAQVQGDVRDLIALYRLHGYFDAKVEPKTIKAKNDRVDLVFEIKEGDKLAVRQILFAGSNAFGQDKLRSVIKTGASNVLSFLLDNDVYDADRIEADRDLVRRFYLAHGYADVRVRAAASYEPDRKGVVLTFTIEEGAQYRIGAAEVESSVKSVDAGTLRPYLRTRAGDIYDADAVEKSVEDATLGLAKQGEPFAAVIVRSERMPESHLINLVYAVDAGKRLYVERIDIHGNTRTRDEVIRREFEFVEGDAYNRALIDRAERHLKQLGFFKSVKIGTKPGSAPDRIVVDVAVDEDKTGDFKYSGGYSSTDGWALELSIGDHNFLGTGDAVKASVLLGQYARGFDLGFTDPYALGPRLSLGVDLFGKETFASSYQSYDSTFYGAKLAVGTPLNDQTAVQWNYSIYNQGLTLDPAFGTASLPIQQAAATGPIWVSSVGTGLSYSTLDNPRNPTSGIRTQSNVEFAGLGGAAKFARTTQDARYYHPIVGDVVGMVRAQSGYATPWGGQSLPLLDGFFGGPQLVRGFAPNGFGPRDITPGTTQDNLGGNVYWTTTAELQAPMPLVTPDAQLKVALFSDAGSLWATNASSVTTLASSLSPAQQIANSHAIRASVGGSIIWDSMFGPIRVDYAYPVAKQSYDVVQRLNFTAGGFW
jgi:outer membrane protein insertion porin family